jgi:hypothetical protein
MLFDFSKRILHFSHYSDDKVNGSFSIFFGGTFGVFVVGDDVTRCYTRLVGHVLNSVLILSIFCDFFYRVLNKSQLQQ